MRDEAYRSALPAKRMAVGALFRDAHERVLIVQPTYRLEWLIPGGAVEHGESPHAACIREVNEELGLTVTIGRVLCVDYRPADGAKSACVHFILMAACCTTHRSLRSRFRRMNFRRVRGLLLKRPCTGSMPISRGACNLPIQRSKADK